MLTTIIASSLLAGLVSGAPTALDSASYHSGHAVQVSGMTNVPEVTAVQPGLQPTDETSLTDRAAFNGCPPGWDFVSSGVYGLCCGDTKNGRRCFVHGHKRTGSPGTKRAEVEESRTVTPDFLQTSQDRGADLGRNQYCPAGWLEYEFNGYVHCCRDLKKGHECFHLGYVWGRTTGVKQTNVQEPKAVTPDRPASDQGAGVRLAARSVCPATWELIEWPSELMCCPREPFSADRCYIVHTARALSSAVKRAEVDGPTDSTLDLRPATLQGCPHIVNGRHVVYCCPMDVFDIRKCYVYYERSASSHDAKRAELPDTTNTARQFSPRDGDAQTDLAAPNLCQSWDLRLIDGTVFCCPDGEYSCRRLPSPKRATLEGPKDVTRDMSTSEQDSHVDVAAATASACLDLVDPAPTNDEQVRRSPGGPSIPRTNDRRVELARLPSVTTPRPTEQKLPLAKSPSLLPNMTCPPKWQVIEGNLLQNRTVCCAGNFRTQFPGVGRQLCCMGGEPGRLGAWGCKAVVYLDDPDYDDKVNEAAGKLGLGGPAVPAVESGKAKRGEDEGGDGGDGGAGGDCAHGNVEQMKDGPNGRRG